MAAAVILGGADRFETSNSGNITETVPNGNGACHHLRVYLLGGQGVMAAQVISVGVGGFGASESGDAIAASR